MKNNTLIKSKAAAGFWRRIAAIFYDLLLISGILIFSTYLTLPFTHGQAVKAGNHWYQAYLFFIILIFYAGFWYWRGQTLGMLAWRMKLVSLDGHKLKLWQVLIRFFMGALSTFCFAFGLIWIFTNKKRQSFYDWISGTRVIKTELAHAPQQDKACKDKHQRG